MLASLVLDPPGHHPIKHRVKFGRDGQPFFVPGPNDNVQLILSKLKRTVGEGNYGFLLNMGRDLDL
jgi:hypothetical protein